MNFNSRHIVIVDDEASLGQICQELLTANGFKATLYTSATEAMNGMQNPDLDLLITDVGLADKSGYEFANELNAKLRQTNRPEVPVIFISGGFLPQVNASESNCYYLEKPFSIYTLLRQVKVVFESQVEKKQAG